MSGQYDSKSLKLRRRQIVQKPFGTPPPPGWETAKDIATKNGETKYIRDRALATIVQMFTPISARYDLSYSLRNNIHIFLIGDFPGGLPSHAMHF